MDHQVSDQRWQQLQSHIEGFLGQAIRNDLDRIQYEPRFTSRLMGMPSECHQSELQEMVE